MTVNKPTVDFTQLSNMFLVTSLEVDPEYHLTSSQRRAMTSLTSLTSLDLKYQRSGWKHMKQVFKAIPNRAQLKRLNLRGSRLQKEGTVALAELLKECTSLEDLILSGSEVEEDNEILQLAESLPTSLLNLDLSGLVTADPDNRTEILRWLTQLTSLQTLDLTSADLQSDDMDEVAAAIEYMPHLTRLILNSNFIDDEGLRNLYEAQSTSLEELQIYDNAILNPPPGKPEGWKRLTHIMYVEPPPPDEW